MRKRPCRHKLLHNWALCQQTMSNIVNPVARGTGHCRRGCDIVANTAAQGGGVAVVGGTAVALSRIVVEGNSASTRAGGLLVRGNTVVVSAGNDALVVENRVTDTTACGGGVAVDMGAVLLHDGSVAVTNNTATSGTASGRSPVVDCTSTLTWCEHQPVRLSTGGFGCTATRVSVAAVLRWQESRLWSKRLWLGAWPLSALVVWT